MDTGSRRNHIVRRIQTHLFNAPVNPPEIWVIAVSERLSNSDHFLRKIDRINMPYLITSDRAIFPGPQPTSKTLAF